MSNKFEEKDFSEDGFNFNLWKQIFGLFKPFISCIIIQIIFNIIIAFSDTLTPLFNQYAIDNLVNPSTSNSDIISFIIIYLIVILITTLCHGYYIKFAARAEMGFGYHLRDLCMRKLQELSFSYYDVTPVGWLLARLTSDIARLAEIISWSFAEIAYCIPLMFFSVVTMLIKNWRLALVVLAAVPFLVIITSYFQKRILKQYRNVRKANSKITNDFNEGINGAKTTKVLVLEKNNFDEFKKDTEEMYFTSTKAARLSALYQPLVIFISSLASSLVIYFGGLLIFSKELSFGNLLVFTSYALLFFDPIMFMSSLFQEFQMAQASGERIIHLLAEEIKIKDSEEVISKYGTIFDEKKENYEKIKGDIEFKNINFHYVEGQDVLKDFNLKVKAGSTIALVGETGGGKSTIVNLLCRFYEPSSGQILIDGVDYRKRSLSWLHSNLGYVLQAPHLFSGTIKDNVAFGKLDASFEEIVDACKSVNADKFINEFKDGYDTEVGEEGSRLSTGQKQLICFARAVLANPSIFVLDEATASIDTETEKIIQFAINNIMKNRTSFVVAHRLSTIVNADQIIVIKDGKIWESGTHKDLLKLKGYYYQLFTNQFSDDLDKITY